MLVGTAASMRTIIHGKKLASPDAENKIYVIGKWRDSHTSIVCVWFLVVYPTSVLKHVNSVRPCHVRHAKGNQKRWEYNESDTTSLLILQPRVSKTDGARVCGPHKEFHMKRGDTIKNTWRIALTFEVKPDFTEELPRFGFTAVNLYLLHFLDYERKF